MAHPPATLALAVRVRISERERGTDWLPPERSCEVRDTDPRSYSSSAPYPLCDLGQIVQPVPQLSYP